MTIISQDGLTSINNPAAINVVTEKNRYIIRLLDQSGTWLAMGKYAEDRIQEVTECLRYWLRESWRRSELQLPKA